jgi:hypothetical protein
VTGARLTRKSSSARSAASLTSTETERAALLRHGIGRGTRRSRGTSARPSSFSPPRPPPTPSSVTL